MELREPYEDINKTLQRLMEQVEFSLPYAVENCPETNSPERLFYLMKQSTEYKHDPPGTELIQSMPTLFSNFTHRSGINYPEGSGDCDCFTVSALACLWANGFGPLAVVLKGKKRIAPSHIYPAVWDGREWVAFDLTNPIYGQERPYRYQQVLPV